MKKFGLSLFITFFAWGFLPIQATASPHHGLSATGQGAFEDLARCVRSEDSKDLNIFFLVDSSASLRKSDDGGPGSDPEDLRAEILSQTIRQLNSLNEKIDVHFALDTFDSTSPGSYRGKTNESYGWKTATDSEVESAARWAESKVPNFDSGQKTNWLAGLTNAQKQLASAPHGDGNVCEAIIWFTDGALDVGNSPSQNADAIAELCGQSATSSGSGVQKGIIPSLRARNVSLIGVLLAPRGGSQRGLVSYFNPIVEGRGVVDSSSLGGQSSQNFECGENPIPANYSRGATLVASNPGDLALLFASIPFMVSKGEEISLKKPNEFDVDKGVSSAAVVIPSKEWKLKGPGVEVDQSSRNPQFRIHTVGDISTVEFDIPSGGQGHYKVDQDSKDPIAVFLESGVRIHLNKGSQLTAGKGLQAISGTFSDFKNSPININLYDKPTLSALSIDTSGQNRSAQSAALTINKDGTWSGQIDPFDGATTAEIRINLDLFTKPSGTKLPTISQTFTIPLVMPDQFCTVGVGNKKATELSALTYNKSAAEGKITIHGAKEGNCQIRFNSPKVLADPLGRESKDFTISIFDKSEKNSLIGQWVSIPQGQDKDFTISIDNGEKANGDSLFNIPVQVQDEAKTQSVNVSTQIHFNNVTPEHGKLLLALILTVLGLAIPLGLLQFANYRSGRFLVEGIRIASFPVKVSVNPNKTAITKADGSPLKMSDQDFEYLGAPDNARSFSAEYKGRAIAAFTSSLPKNPFGSVEGSINVQPGEVVMSSESTKPLLNGAKAPTSLNVNKVFFVVARFKEEESAAVEPSFETSPQFDAFDPNFDSISTPVEEVKSTEPEKSSSPDSNSFDATLTLFMQDGDRAIFDTVINPLIEDINTSPLWSSIADLRNGIGNTPVIKKAKTPKVTKSKTEEKVTEVKKDRDDSMDFLNQFNDSTSTTTQDSGNQGSGSSFLDDPDDPWK